MKCSVVRDLLPLYGDHLCSAETELQLQRHLEECGECRKKWEEMEIPIECIVNEAEDEAVSIEPMKKYKRKIKKKNRVIVCILLLSILVIGGISYLSYGQVNHTGQSFETIFEYIRFSFIGREFARGNIDPLLSSLAIVGEDPEYSFYAGKAYDSDKDAFIADTKQYIRDSYQDFFGGRPLKLKRVIVLYHTNPVYDTRNLMVGLVYQVDGIEYYIRLDRKMGYQYYVEDKFLVSTEPITYTAGETDADSSENAKDAGDEGNADSPLLHCRESLFKSLQPFQDLNFFMAKRSLRSGYKEFSESSRTMPAALFHTSLLYTREEYLRDDTLQTDYSDRLRQRAEKLINKNYWPYDMNFDLLSYDKEKHMFRYQVSLFLTNIKTGETCVLTIQCHRNQSLLVVIPETECVVGDPMPQDVKKLMLHFWE